MSKPPARGPAAIFDSIFGVMIIVVGLLLTIWDRLFTRPGAGD